MGLCQHNSVDITRIRLEEHHGLYLPPIQYYSWEPLPFEWIEIFNNLSDQQTNTRLPLINKKQVQINNKYRKIIYK